MTSYIISEIEQNVPVKVRMLSVDLFLPTNANN
jgi:hypothetical protein